MTCRVLVGSLLEVGIWFVIREALLVSPRSGLTPLRSYPWEALARIHFLRDVPRKPEKLPWPQGLEHRVCSTRRGLGTLQSEDLAHRKFWPGDCPWL